MKKTLVAFLGGNTHCKGFTFYTPGLKKTNFISATIVFLLVFFTSAESILSGHRHITHHDV